MPELSKIDRHNLEEIRKLNQRGGRMLSMVDLLEDKTVNPEVSGYLTYLMLNNTSFLTCANPSGTGKTTLMGSLLNLLKPGVKVHTVSGDKINSGKIEKDMRYLVHEIGTGPYHSYLWGEKARKFFELAEKPSKTISSCIHADTLVELEEILTKDIGIDQKTLENLELILFMRMRGDYGNRERRVSHIYEFSGKENDHRLIYRWDDSSDKIEKVQNSHLIKKMEEKNPRDTEEEIERFSNFFSELREKNIKEMGALRRKLLSFIDI